MPASARLADHDLSQQALPGRSRQNSANSNGSETKHDTVSRCKPAAGGQTALLLRSTRRPPRWPIPRAVLRACPCTRPHHPKCRFSPNPQRRSTCLPFHPRYQTSTRRTCSRTRTLHSLTCPTTATHQRRPQACRRTMGMSPMQELHQNLRTDVLRSSRPLVPDPNLGMYPVPPIMPPGHQDGNGQVRVVHSRPKPQCWEHGCNGRQFSTFSNLLRHQREKSGQATKASCPNCGAEFTRTTARNGHLLHDKCKKKGSN